MLHPIFNMLHQEPRQLGRHNDWIRAERPIGIGALSPGVKRPGREADHSPITNERSRIRGPIHPFPHTSSCRSA
jgi:hypothetical protein